MKINRIVHQIAPKREPRFARAKGRKGWPSAPSSKWLEAATTRIVNELPEAVRRKISRICAPGARGGGLRKASARNGSAQKRAARSEADRSVKNAQLTCVFVGAREIRRLNREFRGKDKSTDVLSFAPTEDASLGELVFCPQVIGRQACEHGLSNLDEFTYMLLHGILHLLGYEHEKSDKAARLMYRLQDRIFESLTVAKRPQPAARRKTNVHRHRTHRRKK